MENRAQNSEETRRLAAAIADFLRDQLATRNDFMSEDREYLKIAIQSLQLAFGIEGHRYLQNRNTRPLMDIFRQVRHPVRVKDKIRADIHKEEGNNLMRMNKFAEAEREYTKALELDRWNAIYYVNRASAKIKQGNYIDGKSDCQQALMLNPDYAKAHEKMGEAYILICRPRDAALCFRRAVDLEPNNEQYRNNLRAAQIESDQRPEPSDLLTSWTNSIFGIGPSTTSDSDTIMRLPNSIRIIAENIYFALEESSQNDTSTQETSSQTAINTHESPSQTAIHTHESPSETAIHTHESPSQTAIHTQDSQTTLKAKALLGKSRDGAGLYRDIELEPENEGQRYNLTESESTQRPGSVNLIASWMNSIFGASPSASSDSGTVIRLPTSIRHFAESIASTLDEATQTARGSQETPPQTAANTQNAPFLNTQNSQTISTQETESTQATVNSDVCDLRTIRFSGLFDIIDEPAKEQRITEFAIPAGEVGSASDEQTTEISAKCEETVETTKQSLDNAEVCGSLKSTIEHPNQLQKLENKIGIYSSSTEPNNSEKDETLAMPDLNDPLLNLVKKDLTVSSLDERINSSEEKVERNVNTEEGNTTEQY